MPPGRGSFIAREKSRATLDSSRVERLTARMVRKNRRSAHDQPCHHCRRRMNLFEPEYINNLRPTRDHYPVPVVNGGTEVVMACSRCNSLKGGMTADQWHAYMEANPKWWLINTPSARRAALRATIALIRACPGPGQGAVLPGQEHILRLGGQIAPAASPAPAKGHLKRHPTAGLVLTTGELTRPNAMAEALEQLRARPPGYTVFSVPRSPAEILADAISKPLPGEGG